MPSGRSPGSVAHYRNQESCHAQTVRLPRSDGRMLLPTPNVAAEPYLGHRKTGTPACMPQSPPHGEIRYCANVRSTRRWSAWRREAGYGQTHTTPQASKPTIPDVSASPAHAGLGTMESAGRFSCRRDDRCDAMARGWHADATPICCTDEAKHRADTSQYRVATAKRCRTGSRTSWRRKQAIARSAAHAFSTQKSPI